MTSQEYLNALYMDIYSELEQLRAEAEIHILTNDWRALGGPLVKLNLVAGALGVKTEKYLKTD